VITNVRASVTRRGFLRTAGVATGLATAGLGIEGILAARQAPAYPAGTSLHFLLWKNFSPSGDAEILRQGGDWGKQNNVNVKIEQINPNDLPARAAAAIESKQGPDILQFFNNWQNQYAEALVDVTDICTVIETKYGGFIDYAKAQASLDGRFTAVPHTITPTCFVARKSYLKAAGTSEFPKTWDDLRREGRKWKAAGRPVGQTVAHTWGDALCFSYPYLWSFGAFERDEKGRVTIGSKQTLEALKFFKALWEDAMDPGGATWDDSSNNRAFLNGSIAATSNGASVYLVASNQVVLDDKGEPLTNDIAHAPYPAGPAGVFHYHPTQQLAIPKYSKNIEAAKEFLTWLMEKEQLAKYVRRSQAYQSAALKSYVKDQMWDMFPALRPYRDVLLQGKYLGWKAPADAGAARVVLNYTLIDMLAYVATGKMSPEESLKWGEAQLKGIYGT